MPVFHESGTLYLSGTEPSRAVNPFVIFLEYVRDTIPLAAIDPLRLTKPLMRLIIDSGEHLGIIHTDANSANFLLFPAREPIRVVLVDFADSWTRDAADDEEDWEDAKREWNVERSCKIVLSSIFKDAGLPVPGVAQVPRNH